MYLLFAFFFFGAPFSVAASGKLHERQSLDDDVDSRSDILTVNQLRGISFISLSRTQKKNPVDRNLRGEEKKKKGRATFASKLFLPDALLTL